MRKLRLRKVKPLAHALKIINDRIVLGSLNSKPKLPVTACVQGVSMRVNC